LAGVTGHSGGDLRRFGLGTVCEANVDDYITADNLQDLIAIPSNVFKFHHSREGMTGGNVLFRATHERLRFMG